MSSFSRDRVLAYVTFHSSTLSDIIGLIYVLRDLRYPIRPSLTWVSVPSDILIDP